MNPVDSAEKSESQSFISLKNETEEKRSSFNEIKILDLSKIHLTEKKEFIDSSKLQVKKGHAVSRLAGKDESFFHIMKKMPEIPLKEQLQDIFLLYQAKKKEIKSDQPHLILSFCQDLLQNGPEKMPRYSGEFKSLFYHDSFSNLSQKEAMTVSEQRVILGKFIYLVNQDINKANRLLTNKNQKEQIEHIHSAFEQELKKIKESLAAFVNSHETTKIQHRDRALSAMIPIELAKALISDSGYVNIGIIEPLMSNFLSQNRKMPFEKNIAYALNSIKKFTSLRQKIALIPAPFSQFSPANDLIRITLGLKQDTFTTAIDAKKTALAALISHMRQSPASSCFASFLAIELLSKQLEYCLDDFSQLLQKSLLSRFVDGEEKEFYFLMRTGKESSSQKINLDSAGKVYSDENFCCYIWEVPGIKAACKTIGIGHPKKVLEKISLDLSEKNKENIFIVSISKILKNICEHTEGDRLYNYSCAKLSFESQLHNPLLRIWENVIAGMSEGREHGKLRDALISSITDTLSKAMGIDLTFKSLLLKKIRLLLIQLSYFAYDTDMKNSSVSVDGRSDRGAFILYEKSISNNLKDWKLIQNENDFKAFVLRVVKESFNGFTDKTGIFKALTTVINSDKFIIDCLHAYNIDNIKINSIENLNALSHTPWCDKTVNKSTEVLHIYSDRINQSPPNTINPKNAERLLVSLIEMGRKFPEKTKIYLENNSNILSPLIIENVHACSMMFGSSGIVHGIKSRNTPLDWINAYLIKPVAPISELKITNQEREKLIRFISHNTIPKNDKESLSKFQAKATLIAPNVSLAEYRSQLVSIITEIHNENTFHPIKTIINGLDFIIYKHILSDENQKKLESSTIHFADTNWSAGVHDVHFCFLFNPFSKAVEVWEVYDNGEHLYPLNQSIWVKNQNWNVYNP